MRNTPGTSIAETVEPADATVDERFHIVGIGASAGGLEALEQLFSAMPSDTGLAFVLVLHLSPNFKSHMEELLARRTDIPIHNVEEGVAVQPNTAYIIPAGKEMIIADGRLRLTSRSTEVLTHPIDQFLRSLANEAGRYSIGVILSGTGSDGSRGICDIRDAGGLVLCQDEHTARFDGMPLNAQATGAVDLVRAPADMPAVLVRYVTEALVPAELAGESLMPDADKLDILFQLLRRATGVDFSHYKQSTVARRVERRIQVLGQQDIASYCDYVLKNPEEIPALYQDLLIGVTRFFRDREAFDIIEKRIIPELVGRESSKDELRIWVAGCSTGEEVYSLAILMHEHLERMNSNLRFKIFATDIDKEALEFASQGVYPAETMGEVNSERREAYFKAQHEQFVIDPQLRKHIVFSSHNVFNDAPFTQMDFISCRNLLIYLDLPAQKKALSLFHFALSLRGNLFLGPSENLGEIEDEFETIDARWRLYRKRRDVRLPFPGRAPFAIARSEMPRTSPARAPGGVVAAASSVDTAQVNALYDRLLEEHMPPSFLVDADQSLLHTFGGAERYLRARGGRPRTALLDILSDQLKSAVSGALQHAARDRREVRYSGMEFMDNSHREKLEIQVVPMSDVTGRSTGYLVKLISMDRLLRPRRTEDDEVLPDVAPYQYFALESDLRRSQENLQATVEELETSNEELQAANEEMVASNEELQSTNEELRSVNEELYAVNVEHQEKILELKRANDDMDNLLDITRVGVLFVDAELKIRRYTPEIARDFGVSVRDIGLSVSHLVEQLRPAGTMDALETCLRDRQLVELNVTDRDGSPYVLRAAPYTSDNDAQGLAMTLIDVDTLMEAQKDLAKFKLISEQSAMAQTVLDREGRYRFVNAAYARLTAYRQKELATMTIEDVDLEFSVAKLAGLFDQLELTQLPPFESRIRRKAGREVPIEVTANLVSINGERLLYASVQDLTRRVRDRDALQKLSEAADSANRAKSEFLANMSHEIRTPLTAIMGFTDLIRLSATDDEPRWQADAIKRNAYHLLDIVNDILDLSKIEADQIDLQQETISLEALLSDVHSMTCVRAEEKGLELSFLCDGDVPSTLVTDALRLRQVLLNLLGNAVKFTEKGAVSVTVHHDRATLTFSIRDTGIGIDKDRIEQLFEPFQQGNDTIVRRYGGTGLGLSISKQLVERLGGRILIDSTPGVGSVFQVRLPCAVSSDQNLISSLNIDHRPMALTQGQVPDLQGHVLVAEDQPDVSSVVQSLLRQTGLVVSAAVNGQMAIDLVKKSPGRFDVLIIDIQMPLKSGIEVIEELRGWGYDGPAMALTAQVMKGERERCLAAGFNAFQGKPIDPDELLNNMSTLLQQSSSEPVNKILVVEDHDSTRDVITRILKKVGCSVMAVPDGGEALKILSSSYLPDMVLIDMGLPDMHGLELHGKLAALHEGQRPLYVALTGSTDEDLIERIVDSGFHRYMAKPISSAELISLVS